MNEYKGHGSIGGSDVSAILGLNRWKGPFDVYARIVDGVETPDNEFFRLRRDLEPVVLNAYQRKTGFNLLGPRYIDNNEFHSSLDNETYDRVVEAKTSILSQIDKWGDEGTDQVPQEYMVQGQWYMKWARKQLCDIAVLVAGDTLRIYTLRADTEMQHKLVRAATMFHERYIKTKIPPPMDGSEGAKIWLQSRYPKENAQMLSADAIANEMAAELMRVKEILESLSEKEELLKNEFKAMIGNNRGVSGDDWYIIWTSTKGRATTDWQALAKELANGNVPQHLYEKHTRVANSHRTFRPNFKANKKAIK